MRAVSRRLVGANRTILTSAGSLVGTTLVTSGLGFIYWWLAAKFFAPAELGLGAALVSAMALLGTLGMLGLGTLLIGELPRHPGQERALISTALLTAALISATLGGLFVLAAPALLPDFAALTTGPAAGMLLAAGVSLTAVSLVADQALIGLLRGDLQLGRNAIFAVVKLLALLPAGVWLAGSGGLAICAAWVLGLLLALLWLIGLAARAGGSVAAYRPRPPLLRRIGGAALGHHALNLALQAPNLALPVVVTAVLSAEANGYFYTAWMMAGLIFAVPVALATAVQAVGARAPDSVAARVRFTVGLSLALGALANGALLVGGSIVLGWFSPIYAEQAAPALRVLGLGVFPLVVKDHYVAIRRLEGRSAEAARLVGAGAALELGLAGLGAGPGGLLGLSLGWLAAVVIEAGLMLGTVRTAGWPAAVPPWQRPAPAARLSWIGCHLGRAVKR